MGPTKAEWDKWKREAISGQPARAAFIEGWLSAPGATMDKLDEWLAMLRKGTVPGPPVSLEPPSDRDPVLSGKDKAAGEREDDFVPEDLV